ncbi:MAG TPA: phosphoheptose isomerase, partial [bacterium]
AFETARRLGLKTAALLGQKPGPVDALAELCLHIPSAETARVQECHITIGHAVCELVERHFAGSP